MCRTRDHNDPAAHINGGTDGKGRAGPDGEDEAHDEPSFSLDQSGDTVAHSQRFGQQQRTDCPQDVTLEQSFIIIIIIMNC